MTDQNKFTIIAGIHPITTLIQHAPQQLITIYYNAEALSKPLGLLISAAKQVGISAQPANKKTLEKLYPGVHQGVVAQCKPRHALTEQDLKKHCTTTDNVLWLVIDGVQDPHNLGALFRSALAAGAAGIIAPKDKNVGLTTVVRKVACGAVELLPYYAVANLQRAIAVLQEQGVWVIGTAGSTEKSLYAMDLTGPVAWVLGAEGKGLRSLTEKSCDECVHIPLNPKMQSLNVSVAAGVVLFETVRQRSAVPPKAHAGR